MSRVCARSLALADESHDLRRGHDQRRGVPPTLPSRTCSWCRGLSNIRPCGRRRCSLTRSTGATTVSHGKGRHDASESRRLSADLQAALMGGLLVIGAATSEAQSPVKQVLMLQSFDRGNLVLDQFTGEFRVGLDQRVGKPRARHSGRCCPDGDCQRVRASRRRLHSIHLRGSSALGPHRDCRRTGGHTFARKHRRELFPGTPLLFASVDRRWLGDAPLGENESAVAIVNDFPRLDR